MRPAKVPQLARRVRPKGGGGKCSTGRQLRVSGVPRRFAYRLGQPHKRPTRHP